ncbi:BglG family transcription antiterminator [uncultured Cetobacterium sp.]|uniref:BglG family transcription antiterminator n=2 Tax=Cetobacterium TaxID=180162 RepID=UPI0025E0A850|nr:BglG family transcription antiterminator [uncultured Cetobacterium sp.]
MNKRVYEILKFIVEENGRTNLKEISIVTKANERTIRYDIEKINEIFESQGISLIQKQSKGEFYHENIEEINIFIKSNFKEIFFNEHRQLIILIKVLFQGEICIPQLCKEFDLTRTTIKTELVEVKKILKENALELEVSNLGLKLSGEEQNLRNLQLKLVNEYGNTILEKDLERKYIYNFIKEKYLNISMKEIEKFVNYIVKQLNTVITDETYFILSNYILIMINRIQSGNEIKKSNNIKFYEDTKEYEVLKKSISLIEKNFNMEISNLELIKLTDYFLGCSNFSLSNLAYKEWLEIEILVKKIVLQFKKLHKVDLSKDETLINGLVNHIKPALHRVKNGLKLQNSISKEVSEKFPTLYKDTNEALFILDELLGIPMNEDEVSFIALHFKTALDRWRSRREQTKNIILICGYGYGTSKLLEQQLKQRYNINILDTIPLNQLNNIDFSRKIDLIITTLTTVDIDTEIPIVSINTILKEKDIETLDLYNLPKHLDKVSLSVICDTISKHCEINNKKFLVKDLKSILEGKIIDDLKERGKKLSDFINTDVIKLKQKVETWQEAIQVAGELLVESGYVNEKYIQTMINKVEKYGSYIVITNLLAIPHGELSEDVNCSGMALVSLDKPVYFPDKKPVKYLLAFCGTVSKDYLDALTQFLELVDNCDFLETIEKSSSPKKIVDTIKKYEFLSKALSY